MGRKRRKNDSEKREERNKLERRRERIIVRRGRERDIQRKKWTMRESREIMGIGRAKERASQ